MMTIHSSGHIVHSWKGFVIFVWTYSAVELLPSWFGIYWKLISLHLLTSELEIQVAIFTSNKHMQNFGVWRWFKKIIPWRLNFKVIQYWVSGGTYVFFEWAPIFCKSGNVEAGMYSETVNRVFFIYPMNYKTINCYIDISGSLRTTRWVGSCGT